jgi:hypothetical protein
VAEIVNLRSLRKRKERAEKSAKAEENRRTFGMTKAERTGKAVRDAKLNRDLDGKKLDRD